jgi:hypothetical protein
MSHITLEGKKINFESIHINFIKTVERNNNYIIKFEDSFMNQSKDLILIKTITLAITYSI